MGTHLFLLLVEVVDDDTNEEIKCEEGAKDNEDDEIDVHVQIIFILWLIFNLKPVGADVDSLLIFAFE